MSIAALTTVWTRAAVAVVLLVGACPALAQQNGNDPDAKAVIVASSGCAPEEARFIVATTFPSGEHVNSASQSAQSMPPPVIAVKHLLPTKARILMMLALTKTQTPSEVQKIVDAY